MLLFRLLLVFFIFETDAIRHFSKKLYRTIVTGKLTCKYRPRGAYTLLVMEGSPSFENGQILFERHLQYGFDILAIASTYSYKKPKMFVKIIHSCNNNIYSKQKVFIEGINQTFIKRVKSYRLLRHQAKFNLGNTELSNYPGLYLSRYMKRRASE
uniref:Transthyretin-like family protein n=1 Tax=Strongyloides papillosus TaxID=174720 RepID=A0A0N5BTT1_STREA